MNRSNHRFPGGRRLSQVTTVISVIALGACWTPVAGAQTPYQTSEGERLMFESSGAARLVEKVRSAAQGVVVAVHVKPGDVVRKGQLLGNLEFDSTKLQLDLARHAMLSKANVNSAKSQAEAWSVNREETEQAVRRRKADETRLDWAIAMEKMYQANYELQLDAEGSQQIQYDYWKDQYEKRFFRAPIDGVVSEVLVDIGKPVNFGTHLFTLGNEGTYTLPVAVPVALAEAAVSEKTLPVRSADGKSVARALVDGVMDDPREAGRKIVRLLVRATDFPATVRPKLAGMKFDVLLPQSSEEAAR